METALGVQSENARGSGDETKSAWSDPQAIGLAGSLDDAFPAALANLAAWIAEDYKLAPPEMAQGFGKAAECG